MGIVSSSGQGWCPAVQGRAGQELGAAQGRFLLTSGALNREFCSCPCLSHPQGADLSQTHGDSPKAVDGVSVRARIKTPVVFGCQSDARITRPHLSL